MGDEITVPKANSETAADKRNIEKIALAGRVLQLLMIGFGLECRTRSSPLGSYGAICFIFRPTCDSATRNPGKLDARGELRSQSSF